MTQRTFTGADLERMAAAIRSNPIPEAGQQAYGPAARVLLTTLADGRPATIFLGEDTSTITATGKRIAGRTTVS